MMDGMEEKTGRMAKVDKSDKRSTEREEARGKREMFKAIVVARSALVLAVSEDGKGFAGLICHHPLDVIKLGDMSFKTLERAMKVVIKEARDEE